MTCHSFCFHGNNCAVLGARSFQGSKGHIVESIPVIIIENSGGLIIYLRNVFFFFFCHLSKCVFSFLCLTVKDNNPADYDELVIYGD